MNRWRVTGAVGSALVVSVLSVITLLAFAGVAAQPQQSKQQQPREPAQPSAPITALVDQLADLFPRVQGQVVEVQGDQLTLDRGRKDALRVGLGLEVYREGREIKHPRTGQVLGRAEQSLGTSRVTDVQETFATAKVEKGSGIVAGDLVRTSADKVRITLFPLRGGVREGLVEAATQELVERLNASGRFQVTMGDAANVYLRERQISAEDFLAGKGVPEVSRQFKYENILAVHFKRVDGRAFMESRFFAGGRAEAAASTAFFVPPAIRAASQSAQFSAGKGENRPEAKPRSLLSRLLGGDLEAGSYSSAESTMPLREVARFPFAVLVMDIAIAPKDKLPRVAVSDGEKVYMYRIADRKLEAEWSTSVRGFGRVIAMHLVDLDGDGLLEVVASRYHPETGLTSFAIEAKNGKPRTLADDLSDFLFAVDTKREGHKQTLWAQRFSPDSFFTRGQADEVKLRKDKLIVERPARVPSSFRPMGATFSNIMGKDTWSLAMIDERNRLEITSDREELWRSSTSVGGGLTTVELVMKDVRGGRSSFYKMEPTPHAVDLDNDGVDEIVVPQNVVKAGLLAVVFRGPAGVRLQSIDSGFEGTITALGSYKHPEDTQPTLIVSVVRFKGFIQSYTKGSGETQIIMTLPQE
jgi:hypothetical protein